MVYCVYSLKSPHRGDFNENTQLTFTLQKSKEILIKLPALALISTFNGLNYPCLELIFMVPEVFEPLKFDCISFNSSYKSSWFVDRRLLIANR